MKWTSGGNEIFWMSTARPSSPGNSALTCAATESSANTTAVIAHMPAMSALSRRVQRCANGSGVAPFTSSGNCFEDDSISLLFLTSYSQRFPPPHARSVRCIGHSAEQQSLRERHVADPAGHDVAQHSAHRLHPRRLVDMVADGRSAARPRADGPDSRPPGAPAPAYHAQDRPGWPPVRLFPVTAAISDDADWNRRQTFPSASLPAPARARQSACPASCSPARYRLWATA